MRVAALYLGLVGGMTGLFWAAGVLTFCPGSCPLGLAGMVGMDTLLWGAAPAYFLSVAGVTGWLFAFTRPRLGGGMMMVAGAGNVFVGFPLFVIPGVLMLAGGLVWLVAGRSQPKPERVT